MSAPVEMLAGGWPLAVMVAALVAGDRVRQARRREALNRAMHELRRPLQALALGTPGHASHANGNGRSLDLTLAALAELDRVVNGDCRPANARPVQLRPLVEDSLSRWRRAAALADSRIELRWGAGSAAVLGDPHRLSQALDNLVVNALEHGGPPVVVDAHLCARGVRIAVRDHGSGSPPGGRARIRPRAGHGLSVAAAVASEHGGRFAIRYEPSGAVAVLELPLASLPLPAVATARAA